LLGVEDGEEEDGSRLMLEAMPWMRQRTGYYNKNLYLCLHEEIMDFVVFMSPSKDELALRSSLIREMTDLVAALWDGATLETFGSHHTQMFLPNSDIDMVIFGVEAGTGPLFELASKLEELEMVSYLEVIDKARIPIVKFVHKATNIQVDVSFNIGGGLATADLVKHYMRVHPAFRPLTLVIKYFLAQRGLNETFAGGIGSFLVQLMVVSFLQHHRRNLAADHDDPKYNNLGQLLVGFFTLYGRDFNYNDLAISVRNGGSYFRKEDRGWYDDNRPFLISMENPNEPNLDIGKNSYEVRTVRRSFDYARQVLTNEIHRRGQFHPLSGSILGTIIPPDSHLVDREPPGDFGYEILHHDPKKTAEIRRQYETRRDEETRKKKEDADAQRARRQQLQPQRRGGESPPAKRWRGRTSRHY
jgi:non-canonical poly(A) RNA polymerase PAPD5/7